MSPTKWLRQSIAVLWTAVDQFNRTDGWAIASHVALTALMAMFPFLIFLTAVASFLDLTDLAQTVVDLIFAAVPQAIAAPIAKEVNNVLLIPRGDLLTIGVALAVWFASNGVEALRVGLNRAYGCMEERSFVLLRLESIGFVVIGSLALLTLGIFVVVAPVAWHWVIEELPVVEEFGRTFAILRWGGTLIILGSALLIAHMWLPSGRRTIGEVLPGIVITLSAWILGGVGFATYLSNFGNYASTYAGLAGVMTALVFLYLIAAILLFGASINAARIEHKKMEPLVEQLSSHGEVPTETAEDVPR